jgi:hypothetical protein
VTEDAHPMIMSKEFWDRANAIGRGKKDLRHKPKFRSRYLLTGLIHCSKCGFAFQGWSGKAHGKEYLRYIDGGWQTKRVCEFLSIPRDYLEEFALSAVKETLTDSYVMSRIEEHLSDLFGTVPSRREQECAVAPLGIFESEPRQRSRDELG